MNPFDYTKAFGDFWAAQSQAMLKVQEQAGKAVMEGVAAVSAGKMPSMPGLSLDFSGEAAEMGRASQSLVDLWSAANALSGLLVKSAGQSGVTAGGKLAPGAEGDVTIEATFRKIFDPRNWMAGSGEMDEMLGRMAEGPRFADMGEIERRYARVMAAWMTLRRRSMEHNAVVLEGWLKAGTQFTEQMTGKGGEPAAPDPKQTMALWTETANRQMLQTQRSEAFLGSQAAMIRASTELRMAQQEMVEHFGKQYGFPTRTELDDVHRTVTELRRELRAMRREQRAAPIGAGAPAAVRRASARVRLTEMQKTGLQKTASQESAFQETTSQENGAQKEAN